MHREERFCGSPDSERRSSKDEVRRHHRRGGRHDRSSSCSRSSDDEKDVSNTSTRRRRSSSSSQSSWRRRRGRRNSSSGSSDRRTPHRRRRSPRSSFRLSRETYERRRSSYSRHGGDTSERFRSPRHRYSRASSPPSSSRQQASDHGPSVPRSRWLGKTNTVMARELPTFLDEAEIREDLMTLGFTITDLRLVRRKDTGVSRGFGFIDLISAEEAEKFLEYTQGSYLLLNEYPITLLPSPPRWDSDEYRYHRGMVDASRDWECIRCGIRNFKRREFCFKCNLSKEDSDRGRELDGSEAISAVPCNTLVLRGLNPVLVSKEYIMDIVERSLNGSNIKPLDAFVVPGQREDDRSFPFRQCNSFAFVEFSTIHEATVAMEKLKNLEPEPLIIDGFEAFVDFARAAFVICVEEYSGNQRGKMFRQSVAGNPMLMAMHQHGNVPIVSAGVANVPSSGIDSSTQYWPQQQQRLAASADWNVVPVNHPVYVPPGDRTDQLQSMASQADQANVGAAVAQAALKNLQAVKHRTIGEHSSYDRESKTKTKSSVASAEIPQADTSEREVAVPGDTGQVSAGQTVMPAIGPNAMYWDGSQWVYVSTVGIPPVPVVADHSSQMQSHLLVKQQANHAADDQGKQSKISAAKKIAKEMEKWASSQNKQKAAASKRTSVLHQQSAMPAAASAASVQRQQQQQILLQQAALSASGSAVSKSSFNPRLSFSLQANNNLVCTKPLVASAYGSGEQSDEGDDRQGEKRTQENCSEKLVDWVKLACLLCKRKFNSKEILDKHIQMSALHKENLAKLEKSSGVMQCRDDTAGIAPVKTAPSTTDVGLDIHSHLRVQAELQKRYLIAFSYILELDVVLLPLNPPYRHSVPAAV